MDTQKVRNIRCLLTYVSILSGNPTIANLCITSLQNDIHGFSFFRINKDL